VADIKFCGLTRPKDAAMAVELGAAYVGVIFAGGPRQLTPERAAEVLAEVPPEVTRVGVFADQSAQDIANIARTAGLQALQLHGEFSDARLAALRKEFDGEIWPVLRISGDELPHTTDLAFALGDAVVCDALAPGGLGGTGVTLHWSWLAEELDLTRGGTPLVLAGGLRAENVAAAIAALAPDVVDVSSGVESAPGIKDHDRMRAFRDAVVQASIPT
jgi:phosphoribosylanthranilate isomerase